MTHNHARKSFSNPKGSIKLDMMLVEVAIQCILVRRSDLSVDDIASQCIHGQLVTNEWVDGTEERTTNFYTLHEECKHIKRMIEWALNRTV